VTLAAGLASDPDEDGDCTRYVIDLGSSGAETDDDTAIRRGPHDARR